MESDGLPVEPLRCLPFPTCIVHLITCYKVVHGLVSVSRSGKTKARNVSVTRQKAENCDALEFSVKLNGETSTGVNPAGDAGDTSPNILVGGTSTAISPQYYYVLSDIADQYWLPSVRSASSRFHSAIRRHQFATVRQADSRLTRLVPPTLNSR